MKFYLSVCLVLISTGFAHAQFTRHIVEFKNKKGTPFTIAQPSAYLSPKALERRTRQKIAIDSTDLPVNPAYLDSIAAVPNVTVINVSKWLNQVCIRTSDPAALTKINAFPFVKSTAPIGYNNRAARRGFYKKTMGTLMGDKQQQNPEPEA